MLISVIAVGAAVIVGLAVAIGRIEGGGQEVAWRHIAAERRELAEHATALAAKEQELWEWEAQLGGAAESRGCPVCELRRARGERPAS